MTHAEAFEKFLKDNLFKFFTPLPWQEFRDDELWIREVNLVLDVNKEGLTKLYKSMLEPKKTTITM